MPLANYLLVDWTSKRGCRRSRRNNVIKKYKKLQSSLYIRFIQVWNHVLNGLPFSKATYCLIFPKPPSLPVYVCVPYLEFPMMSWATLTMAANNCASIVLSMGHTMLHQYFNPILQCILDKMHFAQCTRLCEWGLLLYLYRPNTASNAATQPTKWSG